MNKIKVLLKKLHSLPDNMLFGYRMTFTSAPLLTVMMSLNYLLQRLMPLFEAFALKEMINGIINEASYISILIWTAAFVGAGIVSKLIVSLGHLTFSALEKKTIHKINTILIDKIVSSDLSFFDSPKDHNVLNVVEENRYLINNISWQSIWMAANIASLAAAVFLLVAFSPAIALLNALCVIPAVILNKNYYDFIWRYDWIKSNDYRKMYYFYDVLTDRGYAEEMRLYNNGSYFASLYFNMWRSWYRDKNKYGIRHNFRMFGANLLQTAAMAVTFVSSVLSFAAGKIGIGNIQYYVNLSEQVKSSLVGIFKTVTDMQVDSQKISVIRDFLNWEPKIQSQGRLIPSRMPEISDCFAAFSVRKIAQGCATYCTFVKEAAVKRCAPSSALLF